ncbi:MAG: exodeoxyribonuclease VII small subunit [Thermomicrobium sp.]|nr:exodeoxyribonuclease VII small subunit [Thermomicrobium sp.]MDW8060385.1 exodeoxyribonuclease VII small subunit [Thermomicrobium sp.]
MAERLDGSDAPPHPIDLFEQLVREVEAIVQRLESGDLPLAEAIREYQRGIELIRQCNEALDQAELQINQLRIGSLASELETKGFYDLANGDDDLPFS